MCPSKNSKDICWTIGSSRKGWMQPKRRSISTTTHPFDRHPCVLSTLPLAHWFAKVKKVCQQEQTGICKGESVSLALPERRSKQSRALLDAGQDAAPCRLLFRGRSGSPLSSQRKDLRALPHTTLVRADALFVVASPDPQRGARNEQWRCAALKLLRRSRPRSFPTRTT